MKRHLQHDLADALKRAHQISPTHIIQSKQLSRVDRGLLKNGGFLVEIIRGWYVLTTPQTQPGDTTFWHLHFWSFVAAYLRFRHGERYCISPEQSIDLWTESFQTPKQLMVLTERGGVFSLNLPNESSLLLYPSKTGLPVHREVKQGVQVMSLPLALIKASPTYFTRSQINAELAFRMVRGEELSRALLSNNINITAAGRMIGGLRHLGLEDIAHRVNSDLKAIGLSPKSINPFEKPSQLPEGSILQSPYAGRIEAMWTKMREEVLAVFPSPPNSLPDPVRYLEQVNEIYKQDAYHSLSIEGYQVTPEFIQKIAEGLWNPSNEVDHTQVNAMAAKGYYEAFQQVLLSVKTILKGESPGRIIESHLQNWYRALFSSSVQANIIPAAALAGYRDRRVFIRGSSHVPPGIHAVPHLMEAFFTELINEPSSAVRAVLGHFIFVFIHPYSDGNGRIGRFLMNAMLASGGYNWTIVRVEERKEYMAALERASVEGNISSFAQFIANSMTNSADRNYSANRPNVS